MHVDYFMHKYMAVAHTHRWQVMLRQPDFGQLLGMGTLPAAAAAFVSPLQRPPVHLLQVVATSTPPPPLLVLVTKQRSHAGMGGHFVHVLARQSVHKVIHTPTVATALPSR